MRAQEETVGQTSVRLVSQSACLARVKKECAQTLLLSHPASIRLAACLTLTFLFFAGQKER